MAGRAPLPGGDDEGRARLREYALLLPRVVKLLYRLMRDPRVPARSKALLVVVGAYLTIPVDLMPDFVPGVGQLDDLLLAAFALDQMLNRVPAEVVYEHWEGDEDVLAVVREVLDIASGFVPAFVRRRLGGR